MYAAKKLQSALDALTTKRSQITGEGWYLQHCWLVQVKPGGNARTDRKYWQVRSRQPMFDGKTLKHLKPDEVEDYKAALARGRQLKQIDREIEKLQQQLKKLIATTDSLRSSSTQILHHRASPPYQGGNKSQKLASSLSKGGVRGVNNDSGARFESTSDETSLQHPILSTEGLQEAIEGPPQTEMTFTDVAEQERLVQEVLAISQELRASLYESAAVSQRLRAGSVNVRNGHPHLQ